MTATSPKISVVIPVRNREAIIGRALKSVISQTMQDFEVIVVDDGSTDKTIPAIKEFRDDRIRICRQDQRGANAARNRGLRESRAPLIAFLDSDDEFLPTKLAAVIAKFDREPDLGTLVDSYFIVDPDKSGVPTPLVNRVITNSSDFLAALFTSTIKRRRLRKATSGVTVRRDVAIRAGLFDAGVKRRQDMEFLVRAANVSRCATTDELLWIKHEQAESISFTGDGFIEATLLMHRRHSQYSAHPRNMAADVVIYLAETFRRRGIRRIADDWRLLARELGSVSAAWVLAQGTWAWFVDARIRAP